MANFSKKMISIFLIFLFYSNLFSGLLPETMVLVGDDYYKRVEDLSIGDSILVYNIPYHGIERKEYRIQEIEVRETRDIVLIETEDEQILLGSNQKIYNRRICKFVRAGELKVGDKLFSPEKGSILIKRVSTKRLNYAVELYDISIKDGNLFLICTEKGTNILVHNFAISVSILTYTFGGKVVWVGLGALASAVGWSALDHFCNKRKHNSDLDDVLEDADKVDKGKGPADVYEKDGGKDQKQQDFDKLNKGSEREITTKDGTIKFGKTGNDETIVDRDFSSERSGDKPTLEIQRGKNDYLKIRYND